VITFIAVSHTEHELSKTLQKHHLSQRKHLFSSKKQPKPGFWLFDGYLVGLLCDDSLTQGA